MLLITVFLKELYLLETLTLTELGVLNRLD